jgi:NADPH:quinone reductase-like Zn-dependent oxidoreductase
MTKAVQFDSYGGIDVLEVRDVPKPVPAAGEVLVEVEAAGINPGEAMIRQGFLHDRFPATFPSGQGSDLAGVVAEIGGGVDAFAVGDEVLGIAGPSNDEWLTSHGVVPVNYGDGLADRLRAAAPDRIDAFLDFFGGGYVELAVTELGVEPQRVNTIIDFPAIERFGVKGEGNAEGADARVLAELTQLIAAAELEVPVAAVYPLDQVKEAYRTLEQRHTRGKIVLRP